MTGPKTTTRRMFLAITGGLLSGGCVGTNRQIPFDQSDDKEESGNADVESLGTDLLGREPFPDELVGEHDYKAQFEHYADQNRFPDPNADLVPELTKARFVVTAARENGETAFADKIDQQRSRLLEPLVRYDAVVTLIRKKRDGKLDDENITKLRQKAGLDETDVTLDDDPKTILEATLNERALTFFDYPGAPVHTIAVAKDHGLDHLDTSPEERAAGVADGHKRYVRQRSKIRAVVLGARDLAAEIYADHIDMIRNESPSTYEYTDKDDYVAVIAFNAALGAESMLAEGSEIITPA